ncbi:MAG: hypothetical protein ABF285_06470 [Pacificibacter sp.]|uniref:hypothetical protein n=1 Tax=Pacificibacter sp. TaxID=1917866 RepID=UPI003219ACA7
MPPRKRLKTTPTDFRQEDFWATKVGYYMLWFEYLALSPSYELARQFRAGDLKILNNDSLPEDFDRVLEVFDDFGDVQKKQFLPWWRERGMQLCGHQGSKPKVTKVAAVSRKTAGLSDAAKALEEYTKNDWCEQGQQNTLVLAVPIGLPKSRIAKEIAQLIDSYPKQAKSLKAPKPKYGLAGKRQNKDMLFRYMQVLLTRAAMPKQELWRVGVRSKVSETYSPELEADAKVVRHQGTYDRMMLTILTSRAYQRGTLIAENAARGKFPSYAPRDHALEFDLTELHKRFTARHSWQKAQRAKDKA